MSPASSVFVGGLKEKELCYNYEIDGEVITDIYGSVIPSESRFNVALSFGAGLRFGAIQFNVSNTHGIYNCTPYKDYVILQDNPLNITMSVMF